MDKSENKSMEEGWIDSIEALRSHYAMPSEMVKKKQLDKLDTYASQFIALCPFALLATTDSSGGVDCSPRGDSPGFMQILNERQLLLPDRPGNNRLDSLENVIRCSAVGLLLLIPGFAECLRINGHARISVAPALLEKCAHEGKPPRSVIVIDVAEVYFHCSKAITRSGLWSAESQVRREVMPSLGRILMAQTAPGTAESEIQQIESQIAERVRTQLY